MRRVLLALLLLTAALAVEIDEETGCEVYPDHLICPKGADIGARIMYTSDAQCLSLQNEFSELEDLGCVSTAELMQPLEYESCSMYVPYNETDLLIDKIDYEYQCSTERLDAGTAVGIVGFQEDYGECLMTEGDEYAADYLCAAKGKKYSVEGSIGYYNGEYSIVLYSQEATAAEIPFVGDAATPLIVLAIAVLLVYALYIWSERKK